MLKTLPPSRNDVQYDTVPRPRHARGRVYSTQREQDHVEHDPRQDEEHHVRVDQNEVHGTLGPRVYPRAGHVVVIATGSGFLIRISLTFLKIQIS